MEQRLVNFIDWCSQRPAEEVRKETLVRRHWRNGFGCLQGQSQF